MMGGRKNMEHVNKVALTLNQGVWRLLLLLFSFTPQNKELAILTSPLSTKDLIRVPLADWATVGAMHT